MIKEVKDKNGIVVWRIPKICDFGQVKKKEGVINNKFEELQE